MQHSILKAEDGELSGSIVTWPLRICCASCRRAVHRATRRRRRAACEGALCGR
ncbi:hypothetical protein BURMUCGD1_6190 [Burkholderia multivorans CGD1]|nr:hypothetical protein BURMUCGD1_6190 [Burkholderia multivorans CGD1]